MTVKIAWCLLLSAAHLVFLDPVGEFYYSLFSCEEREQYTLVELLHRYGKSGQHFEVSSELLQSPGVHRVLSYPALVSFQNLLHSNYTVVAEFSTKANVLAF